MSLHPSAIPPVPEETARVAHAAFRKGNRYLQMRDVLGTMYTDRAVRRSVSIAWPALCGRPGAWRW